MTIQNTLLNTILPDAILNALLLNTVHCNIVYNAPSNTVHCNTVYNAPYNTVQCNTVHTILHVGIRVAAADERLQNTMLYTIPYNAIL